MNEVTIEGGNPLIGNVKVSGAKNSAVKIIVAALLSNEDIVLENVPRIDNVLTDLKIIECLGAKVQWLGPNRLVINGSGLDSYEIPLDLGSKNRTASLLAAPLIFRFGKARIPLPGGCRIGPRPINRWIETWQSFGINVEDKNGVLYLESGKLEPAEIAFKINTHTGTDNAVIFSSFIPGKSTILNAAEEPEVDDLIEFLNLIGSEIVRIEGKRIEVLGKNVFKGGSFKIMSDRNEIATFATAAVLTRGNITISPVNKANLLSFVNLIDKMGCTYEFSGEEMRVWYNGGKLNPVNVTTSPAPGFMTDWQPLAVLLLTQAEGESIVHDTIYTDRFSYTKDLNSMGAEIDVVKPSEVGIEAIISDDMYDVKKFGEPKTIAKIHGPTKFHGTKANIPDLRAGAVLVLAALTATGKSNLLGVENIERGYEDFFDKLKNLGGKIVT